MTPRFSPKPPWLKVRAPGGEAHDRLKQTFRELDLHTVCEEARCPNVGECWREGTATVMLLGDVCTRGCRFCAVTTGDPRGVVDSREPEHVARAIARLELTYVVMTMVDRDDLLDGGADHVGRTVGRLRELRPDMLIETLVGDFHGRMADVDVVVDSGPDVFAHNVEVVRRLQRTVRDVRCSYDQSLAVLRRAKQRQEDSSGVPLGHDSSGVPLGRDSSGVPLGHDSSGVPLGRDSSGVPLGHDSTDGPSRVRRLTKSSLMVGIGETDDEILEALADLRAAGVDIVTIGQYLRPTPKHHEVLRFVEPATFAAWEAAALDMGFLYAASAPLVRSSYKAAEVFVHGLLRQTGADPSTLPAELSRRMSTARQNAARVVSETEPVVGAAPIPVSRLVRSKPQSA